MKTRLKEYREYLGIKQNDFAESIGINKTTYNNYENGNREPGAEFWRSVSSTYNVSIDYLLGLSEKHEINEALVVVNKISDRITKKLPQLNEYQLGRVEERVDTYIEENKRSGDRPSQLAAQRVISMDYSELKASAGHGFHLDDERMISWEVVYNEVTSKADFCLDVSGNSMEPVFFDGDTILIRKQPLVNVGEIGLFILDGNGYVKKRGADCLESLNESYADIVPDEYSQLECVGKVLGVLSPDWIVHKN